MNKKKRIIILSIIGLFVLTAFVNLLYFKFKEKNDFSKNQWAFNNYGQNVNGVYGGENIDMNIANAWKITRGSNDVTVAVVDSGVETSSKNFSKTTFSIGYGYDFYNNDNSIYDSYVDDYHGTYIACAISGNRYENGICGIAPNISILPVKFLKGTQGCTKDAVSAIKFACEHGAQIVNCSWFFQNYNQDLYDIIAQYPSVLFVCAAGNSNINLDNNPLYPACFNLPNIVTVIAVDSCGNLYNCSGYGTSIPTVAAPGVNILVDLPEGQSTYVDGTSVATAYVSGIASLMLSENAVLTPKEIISTMISTSQSLESLTKYCYAGGIIDAYECIKYVTKNK